MFIIRKNLTPSNSEGNLYFFRNQSWTWYFDIIWTSILISFEHLFWYHSNIYFDIIRTSISISFEHLFRYHSNIYFDIIRTSISISFELWYRRNLSKPKLVFLPFELLNGAFLSGDGLERSPRLYLWHKDKAWCLT